MPEKPTTVYNFQVEDFHTYHVGECCIWVHNANYQGAGKLKWDSWRNYEKVTQNNKTYAKIGNRLYSKHAVDRMQPSGNRFGPNIYQARGDYGRSVAPIYVEEVLNTVKPTIQQNGNLSYISGTLEVITNPEGAIVTIMTYR